MPHLSVLYCLRAANGEIGIGKSSTHHVGKHAKCSKVAPPKNVWPSTFFQVTPEKNLLSR